MCNWQTQHEEPRRLECFWSGGFTPAHLSQDISKSTRQLHSGKVYQFFTAPIIGRWVPTMLLGMKATSIYVLQGCV